jgi:hypothetical protein
MSKKRKSYSADFKQDAVSRMAQAKTISGKPNTGLPPFPQALEIPSGFPHSPQPGGCLGLT